MGTTVGFAQWEFADLQGFRGNFIYKSAAKTVAGSSCVSDFETQRLSEEGAQGQRAD
jgi:hypothetical protein